MLGFSHWVTLGSTLNFDADVKNTIPLQVLGHVDCLGNFVYVLECSDNLPRNLQFGVPGSHVTEQGGQHRPAMCVFWQLVILEAEGVVLRSDIVFAHALT